MKLDSSRIPKFCISLKRSTERRELVSKEFNRAGINVKFFDAVDRNDLILPELCDKENKAAIHPQGTGIYACMLSHLELYKTALKHDLNTIMVFEDDVMLCDDFKERIKYMEELPGFDFDFISLGGHFSTEVLGSMKGCAHQTQWNHIFRNIALGGSYGYIITKPVMEFCVRNLYYNFGIDQFLSDYVYQRFVCYSFVPFLVGCRPCVSEITQVFWEYKNANHHFQKEAIPDLNVKYEDKHETEQAALRRAADEAREKRLNTER